MTGLQNMYKVRLRSVTGGSIYFDATPDVSESRNVNYSTIEPIHAPGGIAAYKNTSSRIFNISNAKLISRTREEAHNNLRRIQYLRSWCTPRFGASSSTLDEKKRALREYQDQDPQHKDTTFDELFSEELGFELIGAPPSVLYFSAFSANKGHGTLQHISNVPTVIQSLTINFPSDCDYIPTIYNVPVPTIMTIELSLMETHAPAAYEKFDLQKFKTGNLTEF